MQKLVYHNDFVTIVEDNKQLNERLEKFNKLDSMKVVEHPVFGNVIADTTRLQVLTRNAKQFERFPTFLELVEYERGLSQRRMEARARYVTPSRVRGLSGRIGGVREANATFLRLRSNQRNNLWSSLYPSDEDRHVGIEIELCSEMSETRFLDKLKQHPLARFVSVCSDGSIEPDNHGDCDCDYDDEYGHADECAVNNCDMGIELRVLCKESELSTVCGLLSAFAESTGCYVNHTCGLHVHLDMRTRDVWESYNKLFNNLDAMYERVDPSRKGNTYCKRNTRPEFDEHDSLDDRYFAINSRSYDEHSTLEIRLHHGTVSGETIKNWVNFLIGIVNGEVQDTTASNDAVAV